MLLGFITAIKSRAGQAAAIVVLAVGVVWRVFAAGKKAQRNKDRIEDYEKADDVRDKADVARGRARDAIDDDPGVLRDRIRHNLRRRDR